MGADHLREGDADLMMRLAGRDYPNDTVDGLPWELLDALMALVPCDVLAYQHHDARSRYTKVYQELCAGVRYAESPEGPRPEDEPFWDKFWQSACSWPQRSGDLRTVTLLSDFFPTRAARMADPLHREVLPQVCDEICVSLPAPPGELIRIMFFRDTESPFTERDRQVMTLLRPHVVEIWQLGQRRRGKAPALSPREWEVLSLVSNGLSAAEVGRALFVAPSTVRKHLENIRGRMGVHSASAAAALALPHAPAVATGERSPIGVIDAARHENGPHLER